MLKETGIHRILDAYINKGKYIGSTLDLLEPNHTGVVYPYFLDNTRIVSELTENNLRYTNSKEAIIKLEEDIYANK